MTSITAVPPEILALIFSLCDASALRVAPMVCRLWRSVCGRASVAIDVSDTRVWGADVFSLLSKSDTAPDYFARMGHVFAGLSSLRVNVGCGVLTESGLCSAVESFSRLTSLTLAGCYNLKALSLSGAKHLQRLHLIRCPDVGHEAIAAMRAEGVPLVDVMVRDCSSFTEEAFCEAAKFNLRTLHIESCAGLSTKAINALAANALKGLSLVNVTSNIDDDLKKSIGFFDTLKALKLQMCCGIRDKDLTSLLKRCTALQDISVYYCPDLTPRSLECLEGRKLLSMEYSQCSPSSRALPMGLLTSQLRHLLVTNCQHKSTGLLMALASCCPNLQSLAVDDSVVLTLSEANALVAGCPRLVDLDLSWSKVTHVELEPMLRFNLKTLRLGHCQDLRQWPAGAGPPGIAHLELDECQFPMNQVLAVIASTFNLRRLSMASTDLDDAVLGQISRLAPNLERVNVSQCKGLHVGGLRHLNGAPLKMINATGCVNLTGPDCDEFLDVNRHVTHIRFTFQSTSVYLAVSAKHPTVSVINSVM